MHPISVSQAFVFGLLAVAPLAAGLPAAGSAQDIEKRFVVSQLLTLPDIAVLDCSLLRLGLTCFSRLKGGQGRSSRAREPSSYRGPDCCQEGKGRKQEWQAGCTSGR